jgi:hypothetical protein
VDVFDTLLTIASQAIRDASAALDLEQSPKGIDSWPELQFHPLLADAFVAAGFGVVREQPFPSDTGAHLHRPDRARCDIVLTFDGLPLLDPQHSILNDIQRKGTLFEHIVADPPHGAAPDEAIWMELKVVAQFTYSRGIPGPNATYASELIGALQRDIAKLARDPLIRRGCLLLILIARDEATALHDLAAAVQRAQSKHAAIHPPRHETIPIPERVGNACCTVAIVPL